jgi:hypothetical protein
VEDETRRAWAALEEQAELVRPLLAPGMTVSEAERLVAGYPGVSLRLLPADNPIVTADYRPGRIDAIERGGVLISPEELPKPLC